MPSKTQKTRWTGRLPTYAGVLAVGALVGFLGVWGTQAKIAGAVVASGAIEVETHKQAVQHEQGGRVLEILAKDGDRVVAGDILIQLDDTYLASELSISTGRYAEVLSRRIRLEAERDDALVLPDPAPKLGDIVSQALITEQFEGQKRLFEARNKTFAIKEEQIEEQILQLEHQIDGVEAELAALLRRIVITKAEVTDTEKLRKRGLIEIRVLRAQQREAIDAEGRTGRIRAQIAQHRGQIASLIVQKAELASQRRERAITELRDIYIQESELAETLLVLRERVSRLALRAPVSGLVFGSTVFARQAIVSPATTLMYVVPEDAPLIVNAKIQITDIDKLFVGQEASVRLSALDMDRTPDITGAVVRMSADVLQDPNTGFSFYEAHLELNQNDMADLQGQELVPGMPAEVFIATADRTPLNYLLKPFLDYFSTAFREG